MSNAAAEVRAAVLLSGVKLFPQSDGFVLFHTGEYCALSPKVCRKTQMKHLLSGDITLTA